MGPRKDKMKPRYDFVDDGRFNPTRVWQSALATLGGWTAGALVSGMGVYSPWAFIYMAPFVIPAWFLFVLPHALLLPRNHFLTRPAFSWLYGALWGVAILGLYQTLHISTPLQTNELLTNPYGLTGASITGAVTGLIASRYERARG
jgi:hypothetical protein